MGIKRIQLSYRSQDTLEAQCSFFKNPFSVTAVVCCSKSNNAITNSLAMRLTELKIRENKADNFVFKCSYQFNFGVLGFHGKRHGEYLQSCSKGEIRVIYCHGMAAKNSSDLFIVFQLRKTGK